MDSYDCKKMLTVTVKSNFIFRKDLRTQCVKSCLSWTLKEKHAVSRQLTNGLHWFA